MKKILSCLMAVLLLTLSLSACTNQTDQTENQADQTNNLPNKESVKKISIVATTFPQYDWVRQILGDKIENVELKLLLNNGVDLHSYQPTVEDIAVISNCDMFIYVGGESDLWVEDALKNSLNENMIVINLLEVLGDSVKQEEIIEGMEHSHEHGEISLEDVKDRPLSDWKGSWTTIERSLSDGSLDEYISHQAEEKETAFDTQKSAYENRWKSDYSTLEITDNAISFEGMESVYKYIGYKIVESDHGAAVWYGFEAEDMKEDIPHYIAFSDHGTGNEEEHEEEHEDTLHFHFRYGNESFEALTVIGDWSPTFFDSDATGEEIAAAMGGHSHEHETEADEHVWLSLRNAQAICTYISTQLGKLDLQYASVYTANAQEYNTKLAELDTAYKDAVSASSFNTLLFGDRFPFRYLTDDYGLDYYAAFSGCSAETEASFETIAFLTDKMNELELHSIMVIENSSQSIAKTIIQNTAEKNQTILVLDSMQSITASDISSGATYLSIMESNLEVLKEALR